MTHDAIILPDGKAYAKNDMQELFVQNNQREKQSNVGPDTQLIITNDMAATTLLAGMNTSKRAVMGTNKALQASLFNELGKRSHELVFRHGQKLIPVAKHMDLDTALVMQYKIGGHWGWEVTAK